MGDPPAVRPDRPVGRGSGTVVVSGVDVMCAYGRGAQAVLAGVLSGRPAFAAVDRFDVTARRTRVAATLPGAGSLDDELSGSVRTECDQASLSTAERASTRLFLAAHGHPAVARAAAADRHDCGSDAFTARIAAAAGVGGSGLRSYTSACVAASSALADAAAMIARGRADRIVVAGGYLVDSDQFALFDAGRALADDGQVRPFSAGRRGLLLGDGAGAVVLESAESARRRGASVLARVVGWGRAGDAYHPCQPHPQGHGLASAVTSALGRAGLAADDLGYINAHGSGTGHSDLAETNALRLALGDAVNRVPVSSTKSLHGQSLEASGVVELVITLLAARAGRLPVNAGYLGSDDACRLRLVLDDTTVATPRHVMSLNVAFGGANTALVCGLP
jgi:3-oxoacyl-(acyl-carrier-protein) synthase